MDFQALMLFVAIFMAIYWVVYKMQYIAFLRFSYILKIYQQMTIAAHPAINNDK